VSETLNPSQVIIVAGPNGAGKSTLAPTLLRDWLDLADFVNADTLAAGLSAFAPEKAAIEAGRLMLRRMHELAQQGASFAFETTLATRSYAHWLCGLQAKGYEVHLVFIWLRSPDLAIARVRERVRDGGHDIPEGVVRRRYVKGIRNFLTLYHPLVSTWVVYDNSLRHQPLLVANGRGETVSNVYRPESWVQICEVR
jgi:predicted ABC-type ATPase